MDKEHSYSVSVKWTGNNGNGTADYSSYERSHIISSPGKPDIHASSDKPFRGDGSKHNPETLLLSALSACHMQWYLHLCADAGIVVVDYTDDATGTLVVPAGAAGHFSEATLHPKVKITDAGRIAEANELHKAANKKCFIANSVNFTVHHEPVCTA